MKYNVDSSLWHRAGGKRDGHRVGLVNTHVDNASLPSNNGNQVMAFTCQIPESYSCHND